MTFAFNIDEVFQQVLRRENDVLRYVVKDDPLGQDESIGHDRDVIFAAGSYLAEGALANFLAERSNPLNSNRYIHDKFMLVDPLSDDPIVVTGSANFSDASTNSNDENMIIIRGNTRVADIYFTEFNRLFNHYYFRSVMESTNANKTSDDAELFLAEKSEEWLTKYAPGKLRAKRLKIYTSMTGLTTA